MCDEDIERVLFGPDEIRARVAELAAEITEWREGREITLVGVLTGAFVFLADLVRLLEHPLEVGFLRAASYGDGTRPGELEISVVGSPEIWGRDVVIVEDILDTGHTLAGLTRHLGELGAFSVTSVVLLDKAERREADVAADWTGFTVPDEFLVGYGLDYAGRYRNLPYVGVLSREVYEEPA